MRNLQPMTGNHINWNQVFYFSVVAASGSIKNAAPKLQVTSSTLSEHILQLERDLDVRLFHRHHRKLVLTEQGHRLYLYAKQMFETGQRLIDVVSPIPLGCYPISMGLVPCPSIQIGYQLIQDYAAQFGPLNMRIFHAKHDELEKGITEARFDFGFSNRSPERKNISCSKISSSSLSFFVAKQFEFTTFWELIKKLPLLICNAEPGLNSLIQEFLEKSRLTALATMTADYPSLLLELCQNGLGIGIFNEEAVSAMNQRVSNLLTIIEDAPTIPDQLYVFWSKEGENSESVKRMLEILSSHI